MKGKEKIVCPHCGNTITVKLETHIKPLFNRVADKLDRIR